MATEPAYTHGHHESVLRSHRWRTAANSAGYLLPHLRPGLALLDVGCGPGTITVDLATHVAPGATVGVDNATAALEAARTPDAPAGVRFEIGDLRHERADVTAVLDVDVEVTVSSGTYVRALARDLGAALGTGGHLTALRRTRVEHLNRLRESLDRSVELLYVPELFTRHHGIRATRQVADALSAELGY